MPDSSKRKIIFSTSNDKNNLVLKPARHLLVIAAASQKESLVHESLGDWYLPEKRIMKFAVKYPMNGELAQQGCKIEAMSSWCKAMQINATPTIFINGYQLPRCL